MGRSIVLGVPRPGGGGAPWGRPGAILKFSILRLRIRLGRCSAQPRWVPTLRPPMVSWTPRVEILELGGQPVLPRCPTMSIEVEVTRN